MNYKRINTVFAKALTAGKSGLFEIFLLICIERPELPVVRSYLTLLYILSNVIGFNSVFFFFFFIFLITNHQLLYVNLSRIQLH